MRIIAGAHKGRLLQVPEAEGVRPTLERVREALFSIIGPEIEGSRFLDLYAGSGANGIEALSRGAEYSAFIDRDARVLACVTANLSLIGAERRARVARAELPLGIARVVDSEPFDFVFADPPHADDAYAAIVSATDQGSLVKPSGWLILEHASKRDLSGMSKGSLAYVRTYRYGETSLTVLRAQPQ